MKEATSAEYCERILRALVHIQEHLDEPLPLDELARVACFSPFHFHRIFRGLTGEGVKEHVRRLRLERAAQKLKLGDRPVIELALDAGYESHEAFTRAFHGMFGMAPTEFRDGMRIPEAPNGIHWGDPGGFQPPGGATPPVEIRTIPLARIVFLRHIGPYDQVSAAWRKLGMWAGPRGLFGPAKILGIVHDDPAITPPEKLRYDAALTIDRPVEPQGEIGVTSIPGGEFAVLTHRGPYTSIGETYQILFELWLPRSGREVRDEPGFEHYLNMPMNTKPEDLLTAIHIPLL